MGGVGSGIRPGQMVRDERHAWLDHRLAYQPIITGISSGTSRAYMRATGCNARCMSRDLQYMYELGVCARRLLGSVGGPVYEYTLEKVE